MEISNLLAYILGLVGIYIIGRLLLIPIKLMIKLTFNGLLGGLILFLFNIFGGAINLYIEVTPIRAISVGLLGVPGVLLILLFQWI